MTIISRSLQNLDELSPSLRLGLLRPFANPVGTTTKAQTLFFWRFVLVHMIMRGVFSMVHDGKALHLFLWLAMVLAFGLSFGRGWYLFASKAVAFLAMTNKLYLSFPANSNHFYAEWFVVLLALLTQFDDRQQRELLFAMCRSIIAWVMFFSGLQKLLAGTYFDGAFFASRLREPRFAWFFELITDPHEFERLKELSERQGNGPYGFDSPLPQIMSNSIYIIEMLVGVLLVIPRTRLVGALGGLAVLAGIEVIALELMFGLFALNLLALNLSSKWSRRCIWMAYCSYAGLLAAQVIGGPQARFFN